MRNTLVKRCMFFAIVFVLSFLAVSCAGDKKSSEAAQTVEESTVESLPSTTNETDATLLQQEKSEDKFVFPVTGIRPIAVMIDNEGTKSLPQGGLDLAQVIYEIIVEGGESRLMPVFWGTEPKMIGSVRSSRHYFLDYAMEHDAIYVHFGWSPMAQKDISKFKINNINGVSNGGEIFWDLTSDKYNWQDSYTSTEKIKGYVEKVKYRTSTEKSPVFKYNSVDVEHLTGNKAEKIDMSYSAAYTCGYTYNAETKTYLRYRKGKPQIERVTSKQLEAKNIIIQKVRSFTIKGDKSGRQELNDTGSGNGWYITDGKAIEIKWSKEGRSEPTKYVDMSGNPIMLNPGQTWVQIVPMESKVVIE